MSEVKASPAAAPVPVPAPAPAPAPHQPASTPPAAEHHEPTGPLIPQVGERLRLPNGHEMLVHAVMRRHGVVRVMAEGGPWLDAHGAAPI